MNKTNKADTMIRNWKLRDFAVGEGMTAGAATGATGLDWIDATAPGDTYAALIEAGRLPHPFRGRHEHDVAWVRNREWWWRARLDVPPAQPGEKVELVFEGLDTFATIHLNGEVIGRTDNMFREWRIDIGAQLQAEGPNELAIAFAPAVAIGESDPLWAAVGSKLEASRRNLMRKAQFGWGWDWGPDLPTSGIWKSVRIERWSRARISDLRFTTIKLEPRRADLRVDLECEGAVEGLQAEIVLLDPQGEVVARQVVDASASLGASLSLDDPQLWWTADLGAQPLYTVKASLLRGEVQLDASSRQVGIRTITLDTSADPAEPGTTFFRFVLNGVPIFSRGACWIPPHSFVGTIGEGLYRMLLEQAVGANMNMIRVWGGGIYEHDAFYDLCDQLGLLVWQDFMFACAPYPQHEAAFVENVRQEIRHQVRRLRHHASLALWCGNNECQVIHQLLMHVSGQQHHPFEGALYYDQLMPEAVAELDLATAYWPGSPWGGPSPNSMRGGDAHNWTVWHGIPLVPDKDFVGGLDRSPEGVSYQRYAQDMSRFISEFGIHASPALSTLQRWMEPGDMALGTEGFLDRIKDNPKDKVHAMLIPVTGLPETLDDYVDFTMFTQAEGLKFGIEHYRRRKPHCSGTLIWQLNDCWPCVSWSLMDSDGVGKASLHAVGRAYAPVLASFKALDSGEFELWITNDRLQGLTTTAVLELFSLGGSRVWSETLALSLPPNGSAVVWCGRPPSVAADQVLTVRSPDGLFPSNRQLFAAVKDLPLVQGVGPAMSIETISPTELQLHLRAEHYLLFVHLLATQPDARFSDNYFDLRPGEEKIIRVQAPSGIAAGDITLRCWNNRSSGGPSA